MKKATATSQGRRRLLATEWPGAGAVWAGAMAGLVAGLLTLGEAGGGIVP